MNRGVHIFFLIWWLCHVTHYSLYFFGHWAPYTWSRVCDPIKGKHAWAWARGKGYSTQQLRAQQRWCLIGKSVNYTPWIRPMQAESHKDTDRIQLFSVRHLQYCQFLNTQRFSTGVAKTWHRRESAGQRQIRHAPSEALWWHIPWKHRWHLGATPTRKSPRQSVVSRVVCASRACTPCWALSVVLQ